MNAFSSRNAFWALKLSLFLQIVFLLFEGGASSLPLFVLLLFFIERLELFFIFDGQERSSSYPLDFGTLCRISSVVSLGIMLAHPSFSAKSTGLFLYLIFLYHEIRYCSQIGSGWVQGEKNLAAVMFDFSWFFLRCLLPFFLLGLNDHFLVMILFSLLLFIASMALVRKWQVLVPPSFYLWHISFLNKIAFMLLICFGSLL